MLAEIKQNIDQQPIQIGVPIQLYLNQSLYCEYIIDRETLVVSFNQNDYRIYVYYRSKKSPILFLDFIRDLGFIKYKHFLLYDMKNQCAESIIAIFSEVLFRFGYLKKSSYLD